MLCPRFVGRWVSGVTVGPSPDRVQMRLLAAGQRPVSNVVDVSNYVMLELGKPITRSTRMPCTTAGSSCAARVPGAARDLDHVERELDRRRSSSPIRPVRSGSPASWAAPRPR